MKTYNVKTKWLVAGRLYYVNTDVIATDKKDALKKAPNVCLQDLLNATHSKYCGGVIND